jgi:protein SCO1/2
MIALAVATALGAAVPQALPFTDSSGERVTLARYFQPHRPVVLVIAYARCRMLCNVVLRGLADSIHSTKLEPGRDYLPIVISLDPKESPDEAARRQTTLLELAGIAGPGARARWPYLVGDVAPLAAALDFHYSWDPHTEQFIHPAEVFVISPDGHVSAELRGVAYPELATAIRGDALPPDSSELLRCFHYDPALTRYRSRLQNFFRLGAAGVFFALLAGLGVIVRRRR